MIIEFIIFNPFVIAKPHIKQASLKVKSGIAEHVVREASLIGIVIITIIILDVQGISIFNGREDLPIPRE